MKLFTLERQQVVARPLESVFPFFESPENLSRITPDSLDFRVLTPTPVPMNFGRVIDYTIRLKGLKVRWRTLITDYEPPHFFSDEQINGPFSYWRHSHRFVDLGDRTRLIDHVTYGLPLWLPPVMVNLVNAQFVRPELAKIFDHREHTFRQMFGEGAIK